MKTLINKTNPLFRITCPDNCFKKIEYPGGNFYYYMEVGSPSNYTCFSLYPDSWTLVEEQDEDADK